MRVIAVAALRLRGPGLGGPASCLVGGADCGRCILDDGVGDGGWVMGDG